MTATVLPNERPDQLDLYVAAAVTLGPGSLLLTTCLAQCVTWDWARAGMAACVMMGYIASAALVGKAVWKARRRAARSVSLWLLVAQVMLLVWCFRTFCGNFRVRQPPGSEAALQWAVDLLRIAPGLGALPCLTVAAWWIMRWCRRARSPRRRDLAVP